jgi:Fe-S oxidoreductase
MTKTYFNPGCAMNLYKPEMEQILLQLLNEHYGEVLLHKICCHHDPQLEEGSLIINVCAGCDRRFRSLYQGISTISIWEVLDQTDMLTYPDYHGRKMSIQDACPVREKPQVHQAVRNLLKKMNIVVEETKYHGTHSICCGDDFYSKKRSIHLVSWIRL